MAWISQIFQQHPELAVFLTLALGFLLGKIKIAGFSPGPVLGTLFAGLIIGQFNIPIPSIVKVIFFDLFLFATGYKVGPQFFRGLKHEALPQLALTIIICTVALFTAYFLSVMMHYNTGTAAGLLAGAFTESTLIGTAAQTIAKLPIPEPERLKLINNIPIAYTVTYLVGTLSIVWFLPQLAPRLLKFNLKETASRLEGKLLGKSTSDKADSAFLEWDLRVFILIDDQWAGMTSVDLEKELRPDRVIIERVRRGNVIMEPDHSLVLQKNDKIAITARKNTMLLLSERFGCETYDKELLDFEKSYMNIVITRRAGTGKSLAELAESYGKGISLHKVIRMGLEIPFEPGTRLQQGDSLYVAGRLQDLEKTASKIGYLDRPSAVTDIMFVSLGILIGGLFGMLSVKVFGVSITLTASGGALVMGLVMGWLRSKRPTYGKIPEAALWIFDTLGLALFLGTVGLTAGPGFITGIRETGFGLVVAGLVVALLPHIIGLFVGFYLLKINPVILLGAQSGAGTNTAALKALQDKSCSRIPVLGYTVPYALGNILLTAWGPLIVTMMN